MTRNNTTRLQTCLVLFAATVMSSGKAVAVDMAQTPLFLTGSVEPNIVYMIDDSGSMQFETLPDNIMDEFRGNMRYMFPPEDDVYGDSPYRSNIPGTDADDNEAAFFRSPENNSLYYDPSVDYEPWVKADGTRWDDAEPEAAHNNPARTDVKGATDAGTLDLTESRTICKGRGADGNCNSNEEIYPATYFEFTGNDTDDRKDADNYNRIQIESGKTSYPSGRTYDEEIQNFANWYSYHRSRALTAFAGTGAAFARQSNQLRVGYGRINAQNQTVDGVESDQGMVSGVRVFEGENRRDFFDDLYGTFVGHNVGTPLRKGLAGAGEYYERDKSRGPWSTTPGESGGQDYQCRSSYTVLMTDGYWSGDDAGVGNADGTEASDEITNPDPDGDNFTYDNVDPFQDNYSETLADVAMHYWKRDLRETLSNEVPTTQENPAFWQHMVTYGVGLGVEGSVDKDDAFDAMPDELGESGDNIAWPDPTDDSDSDRIDDLLHASVNSRGGFFSAQDPDAFADGMSRILESLVGRSAGSGASVAANSTRLETDSLVFQGRFDSRDWSGDLRAYKLTDEGDLDTIAWRAAERLDNRNLSTDPRNVLTWEDGATPEGADFEWASLSADQKLALQDGGTVLEGQQRVAYLRGEQSQETQNGGSFRSRDSLLGDIINSRPVYTEDERYGYRSFTTDVGQDYIDFIRGMQDTNDPQPAMVYVGGNDGMLHGFNARSGEEIFSYVPGGVYEHLADLTEPQYKHRYFVDGSATVGDAYIDVGGGNGAEWRRILIGTLGGGGSTVFALDITDPENITADDVLWEFDHPELGEGVKEVSLVRVQTDDGGTNKDPQYRFDVIFGNGYSSDSNDSQLFVLDAGTGDLRSGAPIQAGTGDSNDPNGMATPFVVDEGQDQDADLAYAGDLHGNVWRFAFNNGDWELDYKLFTAESDDDERQPITSKVDVGFNDERQKVVTFGTGKYLESGDDDAKNATPQDLYGLIDTGSTVKRSDLLKQTLRSQLTENGREFRIVSDNDGTVTDGWRISLDPDETGGDAKPGERSVVQPLVRGGVVTFVTIVPSDLPCDAGGESWLTSVNINSGARVAGSFFDVNDDGEIDDDDLVDDPVNDGEVAPTSLKTESGIVDTPTLLSGEDKDTLIVSGSDNEESIQTDSDDTKGPQSWRQVR